VIVFDATAGFLGDSTNLNEMEIYNSTIVKTVDYVANTNSGVRYALAKNVAVLNYGGNASYYGFMSLHADSSNCIANNQDMSAITTSIETTQTVVQFFQNPTISDYHLKEISEAVGAGLALGDDYAMDIDGETRTRWDIGADEMFKPNYEVRGNVQIRGNVKMR